MSNEIKGATATGFTVYALITNGAGQFWNGSSFEAYVAGNYGNYDVSMTEQGASGLYFADFPTGITSSGTYEFFVKRALGGSPAQGDPTVNTGKIDWTGSVSVVAAAGRCRDRNGATTFFGAGSNERTRTPNYLKKRPMLSRNYAAVLCLTKQKPKPFLQT